MKNRKSKRLLFQQVQLQLKAKHLVVNLFQMLAPAKRAMPFISNLTSILSMNRVKKQ